MPERARSPRAWAVAAGLVAVGACGGGAGFPGPRPEALLASTAESGAAFEAIRQAWAESSTPAPVLRSMLDGFLVRYSHDALVPLARVALALVAMRQGDLATAEAQLKATRDLPAGSARDLWTVASAKRLRLHEQPEAALLLLRPLVGKTVDPMGRSVFQEELTLAALTTRREYEAISYMDAWLRASSDDERPQTLARVRPLVGRLPKDILLRSLEGMRAPGASFGYGADIQRVLSDRLVQIATESGDAELARMLLDPDGGALAITGDAGQALGELATSRRGLNTIAGRTVGLLLPIGSPDLRDESAGVLRGVMWALGLPRGSRPPLQALPPLATTRDAAGAIPGRPLRGTLAILTTCGKPEAAPEPDEPSAGENVRLVTRDDAGQSDRTEGALSELAGEGAAIVIASLDSSTAALALRWGEAHRVAVIALVPPSDPGATPAFGFVLGSARADVVQALARSAPALTATTVAPVVDSGELALFPAQGGSFGGLTLAAPVSCDVQRPRAGEPRFPIAAWGRDKTEAWLVSGSPACAQDLLTDLRAARARGVVGLTLEAAALAAGTSGLRVVTAQAGVVPATAPGDPRERELTRYVAALGTVDWWSALGRDAATLARLAVRKLPTDEVSDPPSVEARRATARDALLEARAPLWSTEATGWSQGHAMARSICGLPPDTAR
jgi:hypothetical protein